MHNKKRKYISLFGRKFIEKVKDNRGVSAIEFALVFPILISLYFGVAELTQGLIVDRKVTQISSSVSDLVAQEKTMSTNAISDVFLAAEEIILPYSKSKMTIVVTSVVTDAANNSTVDWSRSSPPGSAYATGSTFALPAGIAETNAGVIVTEVKYDYTSNLGKYITGTITLDDQFVLKPRNSATVEWQ